jgi:hypothetical protein
VEIPYMNEIPERRGKIPERTGKTGE